MSFKKLIICTPLWSRGASKYVEKTPPKRLFQKAPTYKVVFMRHGESEWNALNLFTGWFDAKLTAAGCKEAREAGCVLKQENFKFDLVFTSTLSRAQESVKLILQEMKISPEIISHWRLNERHYGGLTGKDKELAVKTYGEEQVKLWRRSFDNPPPPMRPGHPYWNAVSNKFYEQFNEGDEIPVGESLKMTMQRVIPYWNGVIVPKLKSGNEIFIVAHNNSLRAIIKYIENISDDDIVNYSLPTGVPFSYVLNMYMKPIRNQTMQFYGSLEDIEEATRSVRGFQIVGCSIK